MKRFAGIVLAFGFSLLPCRAANLPFRVQALSHGAIVHDQYCGLYCVYQAGRMTGKTVDLDDLIRADRLSGRFGSTPHDLLQACREYGIPNRSFANATYLDLYTMGGPIIVLVKGGPDEALANHWIMVLSIHAGDAEIFDPSFGQFTLPAAELQSLLGGPAIVILQPGDGFGVQLVSTMFNIVAIGLVLGLTVFTLKFLSRTRLHPIAVIIGTGILATVAYHSILPSGFFHNGKVLDQIEGAHFPRASTSVTAEELIANPTRFVVIDTRLPEQFRASRILSAVNLPITASHWHSERVLANVPSDAHVVLYCNSRSCGWAEKMAKLSSFRRFATVSTLDEGLAGYRSAGGKLDRGRSSQLDSP